MNVQAIVTALLESCRNISSIIRESNPLELSLEIGENNSSGDHIKALDIISHNILFDQIKNCAGVYGIISEEHENLYCVDPHGDYIVAFDPIDGSSNIEFNITTGTIFAIYKINEEKNIISGKDVVCAGYCLYGGITEFVYTDPVVKKVHMIKLSAKNKNYDINITTPKKGKCISVNFVNKNDWIDDDLQKNINVLINEGYNMRYVGSMVADVHRVIMSGGIFLYPASKKYRDGKLRMYYEVYPLAHIIDITGGYSFNSSTRENILDMKAPSDIHASVPVIFASLYERNLFIN